MGDTEDYLDELLGDLSADEDIDEFDPGRSRRRKSQGRRNRRDDEPRGRDRRSSRRDRRRARRSRASEEDSFLRSFEQELFGGSPKEDDLFGGAEDRDDDFDLTPAGGGNDFLDFDLSDSDDDFGTEAEEHSSEKDPLSGIADIISEAKRQASESDEDIVAEEDEGTSEDEDLSPVEEIPDEPDLSAPVEEPALMDEEGEDVDLEDLLKSEEGDEDISDIEDLLNADEEGSELEESRDSFEQAASDAKEGGEGAEGMEAASDGEHPEGEEEKKPGIIAKIFGAIGGIFKGDPEDEEEEEAEDEEGEDDEPIETPEEKKARKKAEKEEKKAKKKEEAEKKKKEKEAAKKEKEAKKKEKAAAKAKAKARRKKKKDTSPKIPLPSILVVVLFGLSLVVLSRVFVSGVSYQSMMTRARDNYDKENFIEAYRLVEGAELKEADSPFRDKSKNLAYLQLKYKQYKSALQLGKNQMALDSLISGVYYYQINKDTANKLGISELYDAQGSVLVKELLDSFDLSADDAMEIYTMPTRKGYTAKIQEILEAVGMEVDV